MSLVKTAGLLELPVDVSHIFPSLYVIGTSDPRPNGILY